MHIILHSKKIIQKNVFSVEYNISSQEYQTAEFNVSLKYCKTEKQTEIFIKN